MSGEWTGAGLPPVAAARIAEVRSSGTWSSALSTGEFTALRAVGFEPVGQVMGSAVYHVGRSGRYWGYHDCLYAGARYTFGGGAAPLALSGQGAPSAGLVQVLDQARRSALERMTAECSVLGGDGVVAAQLTVAPFVAQPNCLEFKVIGTAVRAAGTVRAPQPFTCHLDGQGFAKLVSAGWVPVELLYGMSVGVRHDDYTTRAQARSWSNVEVTGWSELVQAVRADARAHLRAQSGRRGGDGVILSSGRLRIWDEPCIRSGNNDQKDHVAEATLLGTTVARFTTAREQPPRTLTVMPLDPERRRRTTRRTATDMR
ncbi:heavy metal-binding domain-containing protein [Streptomyces broussonetiae]|uniref:Heavy metal-binding domain-containing protein n=1 Tax=Streptomyces broussonetiae TaxID=2686304 RepID=A0A6I6MPS4_9ACTN|nr:heavy metal-binding domain-containing protein [Streptomyces broussonetiae]QHA02448.1 heavy metal-binding domain-containing protein [Streptomyces broussonetiae]